MKASLHYVVTLWRGDAISGTGESINISRTGMLFRSEAGPKAGDSIVVVLDWPVSGVEGEVLKLVVTGRVVRVSRGLVAVSMYSHRLVTEAELLKRSGVFSGHTDRSIRWQPRPVILVEEDEAVAKLVTEAVDPKRWRVVSKDLSKAKMILESGKTPVRLVITRTPSLLQSVPADIPVIVTVPEDAPDDSTAVGDRAGRVAVRLPLTAAGLRELIDGLCESKAKVALASVVIQ